MPDVKLSQTHTHRGKRFAAGEIITVTEAEEVWLRDHQLIVNASVVISDTHGNRGRNKQQESQENATD
ncbi:hypothetical protein OJ660_001980 [Salmonella enterica]|nr:hypothetical protein [Salmonella enterica]EKA0070944.1 hypothetical protein [Salmonella enterica]EKE1841327.1 hypothetical protein [Salmonella enterica]